MSTTTDLPAAAANERRRRDHVDKLAQQHPPLELADVDFTVRRPALLVERYGHVLDYMARAELEVERNVLELKTLLPHAPELDEYFFTQVWHPQEARHGLILDELQVRLGCRPTVTDLTTVSTRIRILGALAHVDAVQDVVRMLYYLTGMTTERSALLAYHRLYDGVVGLGEHAVADTVITPIRRQEPGHYAFYQMSSRALWAQLSPWQRWLVRRMRAVSFTPVGANDQGQRADVGAMMIALGLDTPQAAEDFSHEIARVETDLVWAHEAGVSVPAYVARAFREAVELAQARERATPQAVAA